MDYLLRASMVRITCSFTEFRILALDFADLTVFVPVLQEVKFARPPGAKFTYNFQPLINILYSIHNKQSFSA